MKTTIKILILLSIISNAVSAQNYCYESALKLMEKNYDEEKYARVFNSIEYVEQNCSLPEDSTLVTAFEVWKIKMEAIPKETKPKLVEKTELQFVVVPGGAFKPSKKGGINPAGSSSLKPVTVEGFLLTKYEITNLQFVQFLNENGNQKHQMFLTIDLRTKFCGITKIGRQFTVKPGKEHFPVVGVSWSGANAYAQWKGGRLPNDIEWEYASCGGDISKGYLYSGSDDVFEVAWTSEMCDQPKEVGTKKPNELGLYDMSGNVQEWTSTSAGFGGSFRVVKGGSWFFDKSRATNSYRYQENYRYNVKYIGFRVAFD